MSTGAVDPVTPVIPVSLVTTLAAPDPGWTTEADVIVVGSGLVIAALSGVVPALLGYNAFQSGIFDIPTGLFGYEVHLVTSLFFDIGVYLIVAGLVLDILRSLGAELDRQVDEDDPIDAERDEVILR